MNEKKKDEFTTQITFLKELEEGESAIPVYFTTEDHLLVRGFDTGVKEEGRSSRLPRDDQDSTVSSTVLAAPAHSKSVRAGDLVFVRHREALDFNRSNTVDMPGLGQCVRIPISAVILYSRPRRGCARDEEKIAREVADLLGDRVKHLISATTPGEAEER